MVILLGSQKGGVGKSTIATNLAAALSYKGSVVLIESDIKNATSYNWACERQFEENLPQVFTVEKVGAGLPKKVASLKKKFDHIIIDCAGREGKDLRYGMICSDVLLIPTKISQADIDTLNIVEKTLKEGIQYNPLLKSMVVLTMARPNATNKIAEAKKVIRKDYKILGLAKTVISDRPIYIDLIGQGIGVADKKASVAKAEIQNLIKEIFSGNTNKRRTTPKKKKRGKNSQAIC